VIFMKRKVIQLAGKTLVVSLPSAWARMRGIKKGQEITLEEQGDRLVLGTEESNAPTRKSIDVSGLSKIIMRMISAAYKAGYDEIEIRFSSSQELDLVQKSLLRSCIGFEIVQQGKGTLLAKSISKDDYSEFDSIMRRLFFFMLANADDSLIFASEHDVEGLKSIIVKDDNINRLADFCRRAINKNPSKFDKSAPFYFIIEAIEGIGDSYKNISEYMIKNKIKIKAETQKIYGDINAFLRGFYELFYSFEINSFANLKDTKDSIAARIEKQMKGAKRQELVFLFMLKSLLEQIFDMSGPLLMLKQG